jgi:putative Mg2+ transporter-C (MgtC) family protein
MGPEAFSDPHLVIFMKLFLALLLGSIIGTERAVVARQAAGTRTFGIVSLGTCLFVVVGSFVNMSYLTETSFDPLRVAAAAIMGIGFLGGGLITRRGGALHGTTTAAGLWVAAGLGLAVGFGMYSVAIFTTLLTILAFTGVWYLENRFKHLFGVYPEESNDGSEKQPR